MINEYVSTTWFRTLLNMEFQNREEHTGEITPLFGLNPIPHIIFPERIKIPDAVLEENIVWD